MPSEKETISLEEAQKEAEMIGEFAKGAKNRKEATELANKLEFELEDQKEQKQEARDETTLTPVQEQEELTIEKILDETRYDIRKTLNATRKDIPHYSKSIKEFQEQTIRTTTEIVDEYLKFQKGLLLSIHPAWTKYPEVGYGTFWSSNWISPIRMTQMYASMISILADNLVNANRLSSNIMFASMKAIELSMQEVQNNTNELFTIGTSALKSLENLAKEITLGQRFSIWATPSYYGISMVHIDKENNGHLALVKQHAMSENRVLDDGRIVDRSIVVSIYLKEYRTLLLFLILIIGRRVQMCI